MKKFKEGDFVYIKRKGTGFEYIFIFKYIAGTTLCCHCSSFLQNPVYDNNLFHFKYSYLCELSEEDTIRLATENEISLLVSQMCKHNLTWDKENLKLVDNEEV